MEITKNPIKLKNGSEVPVGTPVLWENGKAFVVHDQKRLCISARGAARALGIEEPSVEQLDFWVFDSVCESILGNQVEPDGIDCEGSPSWLLALGLI